MRKTIIIILLMLVFSSNTILQAENSIAACLSLVFTHNVATTEQSNMSTKRQRVPQKQDYVYGEYNDGSLTIYFSKDEGLASVSVYDQSGNLADYTTISTSCEEIITTQLDEGYSIHITTDLGNEYFTTIY